MTAFLLAVSAYSLLRAILFVRAVWNDTYPRQLNLGLHVLGLWANYLLLSD